jgi:hypothetical protein
MTRTTMLHSLTKLFWDTDMVATRFLLALAEMLWAVMLLWPGDTFDRPTYAGMALVFNEETWAFLFTLSALTQFSIILIEDYHGRFARYFAAWNAGFWSFAVVSMLLSVYPPPAAIAGEIALAFGAVWVWLRPYLLAEGLYRAGVRRTT